MNVRFLALSVLFSAGFTQASKEWVNPTPAILTSYLYAPGVLSSEILMGRYCPHFVASTGETVTCSRGIEVIRLPASSANLSEIMLKPLKKKKYHLSTTDNEQPAPANSFLMNMLLVPFKVMWYTASSVGHYIFGFKIKKAEKPNGHTIRRYWADPAKVNLAQEQDLALFKQVYDQHLSMIAAHQKPGNHRLVLYGTSRGSATVFNFNALEHPDNVAAVICEGLFDSISHVYEATRSSWIKFLITLLPKVSNFKQEGILPIKLIDKVPFNTPILLITSLKDTTVPWQCTMNIYRQLRKKGHQNVHILILKKAGHTWYPQCSKQERALYQNVVHAFYKQYDLPYIAEFAQQGREYFELHTQPPFDDTLKE